jgi:hypothetical protein
MDKHERRRLGAHYTSEAKILEVLDAALLDDLRAELEILPRERFVSQLADIHVLDPACGCGDFLLVAWRELRRIEAQALGSDATSRLRVEQFIGIEIDEASARSARTALPGSRIVHANALEVDWEPLVPPDKPCFIVGNPPFIGKKEQTERQKHDMKRVFPGSKGVGKLDYVCCWFMKAARLAVAREGVAVAFVATNSITQGEQVGILWGTLFELGIEIHFAHRSFPWSSDAPDKAAVHCVIVGFGRPRAGAKLLFEYDAPRTEPTPRKVERINAYLVDGPDVLLRDRSTPIGGGPKVAYGSFALDDGHYTLERRERDDLLAACPAAEKFIRPFVGGEELIHSKPRFCLWLVDATPEDLEAMPEVAARVAHVKNWRAGRGRAETRALARTPMLFAEIRQPDTPYLAFPTLSSEHRAYIPIAFLEPRTIASNQVYVFAGASLQHFGVLTSDAHMTWVRAVCGRLESRYRYSAGIAYNNFPWPEPNAELGAVIEAKARAVLEARATHPERTLGRLYDKSTMPANLAKAHRELDEAVYAAYGIAPELPEAERVAALFERHRELVALP